MFWAAMRDRVRELESELAAIGRSQALVEFSTDGRILYANENFLQIMGYGLAELVGQHHAMFMPAADRESPSYRQFWQDLGRGEYKSGMFKRVAKGGRDVWLQASYNPIMDRSGRPAKIAKIAADVTQARRQSVEDAGLIQAIQRAQAVIEFDLSGNILEANENFLRVMGYTRAEIIGRHHSMFVTEADRTSREYREFWEGLARGEFKSAEFRRLAKGGGDVWLQATYNPIFDLDGKPCKVVKFGSDVTAARLLNANFTGQLDAIHRAQAVIEFDLDGIILSANENFLMAMGYSLSEIVGKHHAMFVNPAERESAEYKGFWSSFRAGQFRSGEFKRLRKDRSEVWLRATYNPIFDLHGKPFKVVKFAVDVTEQVVARSGFNELIEHLAQSTQELSGSITEIAGTMLRSQQTATSAVQRVAEADDSTQRLNAAAQTMGRVIDLISRIAQQINLLALNATIESARAGEAGRGFAVVANEVKNLANQAKAATEEIAREIGGIKSVADEVVMALSAIKDSIGAVSTYVTSTAAAVEQQSMVTGTISASIKTAADQAGRLWAA
jgi:methyl-accepting chemotaxis protein